MPDKLLVISPLHNEAAHVSRVVRSVLGQTRRPDLWLIVDDGSTDATPRLLAQLTRDIDFIQVLSAPQPQDGGRGDRLAAAFEARAFNWALAQTDSEAYDYVGKLDGDIELEPEHYARLLAEFQRDQSLGVTGSQLAERRGSNWRLAVTPPDFVHGAVKLYSRECLAAIGGIDEQLGWDIVDEAVARMHGFSTRSVPGLVARHYRQSGSAQGRLRGHARAGESAWIAHYPAGWILLRSLKMAAKRPRFLSGVAFAFGYARAATRRVPRAQDEGLREFVRAELRRRLRGGATPLLGSFRRPQRFLER